MPAKGQFKLSPSQEADVIRRYREKEPRLSIAARHGIDGCTVYEILRRRGVRVRSIGETVRKYPLNESAFDEITESSAYWIGFLMGDGCVYKRRYTHIVSISLAEEDCDQVMAFREFLGTPQPIERRRCKSSFANCQPIAALAVPSDRLAESLSRYGVLPRKTHTAKVIGLEDDRHFWRGVVDADGSLFMANCRRTNRMQNGNVHRYLYRRPVLSLAGAKPLMGQFADFIRVRVSGKSTVRRHHSIWTVRIQGDAAWWMIGELYAGCQVALDRKRRTASEILTAWKSPNRLNHEGRL
jgi:hypothetical protein